MSLSKPRATLGADTPDFAPEKIAAACGDNNSADEGEDSGGLSPYQKTDKPRPEELGIVKRGHDSHRSPADSFGQEQLSRSADETCAYQKRQCAG
jgi:hypothetical protein